ncbi:hypothetical protein [Leadbetterella sp. DM7]|uniref:hypothetical protein n=1 Tax=Leadbetterella sp. DM7 TaxID=3235085 RepID=UPI00349E4E35
METKEKKTSKRRNKDFGFKSMKEEPKKLSKIGEWLKSGKSAFEIIDHEAILK